MHSISRLFGAALVLCLSSVTSAAQAVPDLWRPTATYYGYQYAMDMSHGDPFTKPYNAVLNRADPQNIPADHDTSADFYLFEPKRIDGAPTTPRPLIVYFHGADMAPAPTKQRAQIEHYVRSGVSVLWMPFCDTKRSCLDFVKYESNAIRALLDGRFRLWQSDHVDIAQDANGREQILFVSFSLGSHVAARIAGQIGALNVNWGALPEPKGIIFHDPAGNEASVKGALTDAGFGWLYPTAVNIIESNGWGWDPPGGGARTYMIRDALPLAQNMLAGIQPSTFVIILGAKASVTFPNAYETARRLYSYPSSSVKRAYVVPHQCVSQLIGPPSYVCPANLSQSSHNMFGHQYYSNHAMFAEGTDNLKETALLMQTTACAKQVETGVVQAYCTGSQATYTGTWQQPNGTFQRYADPKTTWTLTAP